MIGQGINRNQLKYIAIIFMIIDHIGYFFIPLSTSVGYACRILGRITAPVMCYFLAEGYRYTSDKKKYGTRLLVFSIISQFAFYFAIFKESKEFELNMIFNLFFSFLILLSYDKIKNKFIKWLSILILICACNFCDWGVTVPLFILCFYIFRSEKNKQILSFSIVSILMIIKNMIMCVVNNQYWFLRLFDFGIFLFIPIIYQYNGDNGKNNKFNKWFFYVFYPLQFLIFGIIKKLI